MTPASQERRKKMEKFVGLLLEEENVNLLDRIAKKSGVTRSVVMRAALTLFAEKNSNSIVSEKKERKVKVAVE